MSYLELGMYMADSCSSTLTNSKSISSPLSVDIVVRYRSREQTFVSVQDWIRMYKRSAKYAKKNVKEKYKMCKIV